MTEPALNHGSDCPSCGDHLARVEPNPRSQTRFEPFVSCVTCHAQYTLAGVEMRPPVPTEERTISAGATKRKTL